MRLILTAISVALLVSGLASAQYDEDTLPTGAVRERAVSGSQSVTAFRPVGEFRVWRFFSKQKTFGQLSSFIEAEKNIDGRPALQVSEALRLDFTQLGGDQVSEVRGETYVTPDGKYLGHKLEIGDGTTNEKFNADWDGSALNVHYTRGGNENVMSSPYGQPMYFWDPHLVDQLEIYLGLHDLEIGTILEDSIYLPQSLMKTSLKGQVVYFMWQEIYKGKIDSVFIIRLTEPSDYQLYFTPDKKLVRVDMIDQGMRVYQDLIQMAPAASTANEQSRQQIELPFSWKLVLLKLPHYLVFLAWAALALLLIQVRGFRWKSSYLYLVAGAIVYVLMPLALNRALGTFAGTLVDPSGDGGFGVHALGLIPPLVLGVIHFGLIMGTLGTMLRWLKSPEYRLTALGAFVGAGLGLADVFYVSGFRIEILFDWPLATRAATIFLYTFSGAIAGRSLMSGAGRKIIWWALAAITVFRYLPLWIQTGLIDVQVMYFIEVIWVIAFTVVALTIIRKPIERVESDEDEPVADEDS